MDRGTLNSFDLWLLGLAAVLLFFGLGSNSLHDQDEARYALVQERMLATGNWIDFEIRGEPWFNKAPLRVWASAALAAVFGVNEWTVRLPSAAAALGAVAALMWLGRLLYGVWASRWAALVLFTSTQFLYHHCGRTGEMDSALLLVWILAVVFAVKTREDARWWIASLACVALAGMVKHAFYVVPVGGVALVTIVALGTWRTIPTRVWALAIAAFAVVLVPWHAVMAARHGTDFVDTYFGREVAGRVAVHVERGHRWAFYPSVIEDGLFPWSYLLPFVLVWPRGRGPALPRAEWILLVWAVPMVVGPALAQLDLAWYALPALPPLALLLGRWLAWTTFPPWVALVSGLVLLLSPSNVLEFDALNTRAIMGMIGAQTLGLLRGAEPWWPQLAVGLFVTLGALRLWRAPVRARRGWLLRAWALLALVHAFLPLRDTFGRSAIDTLVERVDERGLERDRYVALFDAIDELSDLYAYALRDLPSPAVEVTVGVDPLPERLATAWVIGPTDLVERFGDPPPHLRIGEWAALPPRMPDAVPRGTVPRGGGGSGRERD